AYEGASTFYGPASAEFVAAQLSLLARSTMGEPVALRIGEATAFAYEPPPRRSRLPLPRDETPIGGMKQPRAQKGLCTISGPIPQAVCFWWTDCGPARASLIPAPRLALVSASERTPARICNTHSPLPSPWPSTCDPGAAVDDRGLDFQTRVRNRAG